MLLDGWLADRKYPNSKPDLGHQRATWEQALVPAVAVPYRSGAVVHGHVKPDRNCVQNLYKCLDQLDQARSGLVADQRI